MTVTLTDKPYVEKKAGDLITAEDWNEMQNLVRQDIETKATAAAAAVTEVGKASDADTLGGKSYEGLFKELLERALVGIHAKQGYQMEFRCLKLGHPEKITHDLGDLPLVDIYRLEYFPALIHSGGERFPEWTLFYLGHDSDDSHYSDGTTRQKLGQPDGLRLSLSEAIRRFEVDVSGCQSLADLVGELQLKMFEGAPEGSFQGKFQHSPWFEEHCRETMSVGMAAREGDLDGNSKLWVHFMPRKTVLLDRSVKAGGSGKATRDVGSTKVDVRHRDFNTLTLELQEEPFYPPELCNADLEKSIPGISLLNQNTLKQELPVMVLLKA